MATSAGSLAVFLGLDVGEFTRGLSKAERDAQQFARNTRSAILEIGAVVGGLEIGRRVLDATKAIIGEAAALNDLADATGSSVEALSRLNNQSFIAGTNFADVEKAVLRLAAGMAGTDEQSTKAKEALKALGISTRDPVEALQQVAVKLDRYADGVNKVGIAQALFGKDGQRYTALLSDIAQLQDVNATITAQQAREAEALKTSYNRLAVEAEGFKNMLLSGVVPALNTAIERMNVGARAAASFGQGLEALFSVSVRPGNIADQLEAVDAAIGRITAHQSKGGFNPLSAFNEETLTSLRAQREVILKARQQRAALNAVYSPDDINPRDQILSRRPEAPSVGGGRGTGRSAREKVSEADQYLKSLRQSVVAAQELTATETVLQEVQNGRLQNASRGQIDQALQYAQEIDAIKAATKAREEQKRTDEEAARIRERNSQASAREIEGAQKEAESLRAGNEQMREQLEFLRGGQEALDAYTVKKLLKAAAEKEDEAAMRSNTNAADGMIGALKEQAAALRERAALVGEAGFIEGLKREAQAIQDVRNMFADTFADAFADFISGAKSAKEAFADFANDILRQVSRIAAQNVANQIFGGNNSAGPDVFGVFSKLLGAYFGAGAGAGTTNAGLGGGLAYAAGGTNFARGGQTMVGENGVEMITLPRGAQVMPNHELRNRGFGRDVTVVNNFAFSGPVSAATQQQVAAAAGASVRRASKR